MVSRDEAMTLRKLSCVLGAILAGACTPAATSSSPQVAKKVAESSAFQPLANFSRQPIQDPLGRWNAELESESKPTLLDEAGFVQVNIPTQNGSTLNCFVYDVVLDSGQAVVRFLRAASVGLSFRSFQVTDVEAVGDAPLVFFAGDYIPERSEETPGTLTMMISPRLHFPIVCSHDSPQKDAAFYRISRDFVRSFRAVEGPSRPALLSEIWRVDDQNGPAGFWFYRAYQGEDGDITNLSLSSLFEWHEGTLHSSDSVAVETRDAVGLLRGRWLQMRGTEKLQEITLERSAVAAAAEAPSFSYRFLGEQNRKRVRGEIQAERPMQSSFFLHEQLQAARSLPAAVKVKEQASWSQYIPEQNLEAATAVSVSVLESGVVRLKRALNVLDISLGEDGLPREMIGAQGERDGNPAVHLVLLQRTGPAGATEPHQVKD